MSSQPFTLEQIEAKKVLLWLSFECPLGGNPADCPMHSLRLRSYAERRRMIDQMSGAECVQVYALHRLCLVRKEASVYGCRVFESEKEESMNAIVTEGLE